MARDDGPGPTLNPEYNAVLRQWGNPPPECAGCGHDLTGQPVVETCYGWLCEQCAEADAESGGMSDEAARSWERRQMGITN